MNPALPRVSAPFVKFFADYCRGYLRRRFHSIRILKSGLPPRGVSRPLVIYLNHASWYDPLVCLRLSRAWFADYTSFGPIDAAMLTRYRFFKHLGFYGVEPDSARGALTFLRTTRSLLAEDRHAVWLTPQGRFMDARERPLRLQPGIGAVATRVENAAFVPLAIEYTFWTEPRPEILVSFGEPVIPRDAPLRSAEEWTEFFSEALEATQDELAARSCRRDPAEWVMLDRGASGVNAFYDAWRWLRGEKHAREHRPEARL